VSSSAGRAQIEPLPALVAVSAFVAALGFYAVAFHGVPADTDRNVEGLALAHVVASASTGGVLVPDAIDPEPPHGYEMATVVRADGGVWRTGPRPPDGAPSATTTALVRTDSGEQVGRVRVWVWR